MAFAIKARPHTYVAHVLAVAGGIMVLVWCLHFRGGLAWESANKNLIFNIHPVVMLIGFIILGGEATISYKSLPLKFEVKKLVHLILHGIALILGIIGTYTAFIYHNQTKIAHLYSLHAWLGIAIIVLYAIQSIYGFLVYFYPGGSSKIRSVSFPWHIILGATVYILAIANAAIGFMEKLTFLEISGLPKYGSEALLVNFTAIVTILYGVFVAFSISGQNAVAV